MYTYPSRSVKHIVRVEYFFDVRESMNGAKFVSRIQSKSELDMIKWKIKGMCTAGWKLFPLHNHANLVPYK